MKFDKWIIESGSPFISDINESNTTLTMGVGSAMITATYSTNVSVENRVIDEFGLNIYPNPSNSEFSVEVTLQNESLMDISLLDLSGRSVFKAINRRIMDPGKKLVKVPVSEINPGTYIMGLSINENHTTRLVVIQ